jgi:hypothetical protein
MSRGGAAPWIAMRAVIGFVAGIVAMSSVGAQERASVTTVRGVAYDSLHARPFAGALVRIEALGVSAISDSGGGFTFDSVPTGRHELVLAHETLDSLGLPEPRILVDVPTLDGVVRMGSPSFATLWRATCGGTPPRDSGFVFGTTRSARDRSGISGADVRASWVDIAFDQRRGASQQRMGGRVESGRDGRYAICGVPNGVQLQMRAGAAPAATDAIELFHEAPGVTRRDFLLADADTTLRGAVRGIVRGTAGGPVPNALVDAPGATGVRADGEGRFMIPGVALGTRVLVVRSIGAEPMVAIADVAWRDTAEVEITLKNIATLDSVEVIGSRVMRRFVTELEERKELGIAKFVDSTVVLKYASLQGAITAKSIASMTRGGNIFFGYGGRICHPGLWIDRHYIEPGEQVAFELRLLNPNTVGTIEIYERRAAIPIEYWPPSGGMANCVIVIWTKRNFP